MNIYLYYILYVKFIKTEPFKLHCIINTQQRQKERAQKKRSEENDEDIRERKKMAKETLQNNHILESQTKHQELLLSKFHAYEQFYSIHTHFTDTSVNNIIIIVINDMKYTYHWCVHCIRMSAHIMIFDSQCIRGAAIVLFAKIQPFVIHAPLITVIPFQLD